MYEAQAVIAVADLETVICGSCSGIYALSEKYIREKKEHGGYWNCPYCRNAWGYDTEGSEVKQLERKLAQATKRKEWAEQEAKNAECRRRAAVGQTTKLKNRIGHGVCPCCKRTFQQLQRHMQTKHPDYVIKKT